MGMLDSVYGPLLAQFAHRFQISLPIAGEVLSAHFTGGLVGVVVSMRAMERVQNGRFVAVALGILAVGCALVALASAWLAVIVAVFVVGLGFGALAIGMNQIVAHSFGPKRSVVLNAVNGTVGIGAVIGPALVALLGDGRYPWLYAGIAIVAIALIWQGLRIPGRLPVALARTTPRPTGLVLLFVLAFVLYVGAETGVGGWMTSHLESTGLPFRSAAALTSGFWLAIALGRFLTVLLPDSVTEARLVLASAAIGAVALAAAVISRDAPIAYLLTGLAFAPIFPTGVVWLARLLPGDARATSWLFPAAMLGGAVIPALVGGLVGQFGLVAAPATLASVAFGILVAFSLAARAGTLRANR